MFRKCLIPDLPSRKQLKPWLRQIDNNRYYSNNGPLLKAFKQGLMTAFFSAENLPLQLSCTSSATVGLELVLQNLNLPTNARVLLPSFTFPATCMAVLRSGYQVVLTDVSRNSWQLEPKQAYAALKQSGFDAVIPVSSFGYPVDVSAWDKFSQKYNIPVIIDAAAALGVQKAARYCHMVFSLHATKTFAIGEGGLIISSDKALMQRIQRAKNFGFQDFEIDEIGTNGKLSEYHAAVGLAQLQRWQQLKKRRQKVFNHYKKVLKPLQNYLILRPKNQKVVPAVLPILWQGDLEPLIEGLTQAQIETRRWYYPLLHQYGFYQKYKDRIECISSFKHANYLSQHLLGLPFHNFLHKKDIKHIARCLQKFV